jgi:hypothetical protein
VVGEGGGEGGGTAGHPRRSIRTGAIRRPASDPRWSPEKMKPMPRDRSLCLHARATISVAEVGATPSPKPTSTRQIRIPACGSA